MPKFQTGQVYHRRNDLHNKYGGQVQGGISTPAGQNFIMIFTSERGEEYGYIDNWEGRSFFYTGEGQIGDMTFTRGIKAIRDHQQDGKKLCLFTYISKGKVEFTAQLKYVGHEIKHGRDMLGQMRSIIVFELQKVAVQAEQS